MKYFTFQTQWYGSWAPKSGNPNPMLCWAQHSQKHSSSRPVSYTSSSKVLESRGGPLDIALMDLAVAALPQDSNTHCYQTLWQHTLPSDFVAAPTHTVCLRLIEAAFSKSKWRQTCLSISFTLPTNEHDTAWMLLWLTSHALKRGDPCSPLHICEECGTAFQEAERWGIQQLTTNTKVTPEKKKSYSSILTPWAHDDNSSTMISKNTFKVTLLYLDRQCQNNTNYK